MQKISLPTKVELQETSSSKGVLSVEPLNSGYGTTLGNSLRRVMLNSMPGAAVTAMRIKGVLHEFSTIPHVKDDVVEIILNLKQLRMKIFTDEPVKLELKAKGQKVVHAKDFTKNADVEIANGDLVICELTDKAASFEMEIWANNGRGFVPTEVRDKEKMEIGVIAIDSIYTPIKNVAFKVENVRVGQLTNFDKLVMDVETDGTMTAREALTQSADILVEHFNLFSEGGLSMMKQREAEIAKLEKEVSGSGKAPAVEVSASSEAAAPVASEEMSAAPTEVATEEGSEEPKKKRGRPKKS
ncbi:DNA-directed RNA polymerase subunit alpha [Candidatus Uhrbacteria bacterium]|nr:DNA-directed RNA polymerase subunit alpha [Candidatus Uhrbacteria bacterium]